MSLDSPANLLSTTRFIREIVTRLFDHEDERTEVLELLDYARSRRLASGHFLRFETFMEIVTRTAGDTDFELLACFAACKEPNPNHYLLASLLGLGHLVVTTNFDPLVEIACQRLGILCSQIVYEADFKEYLEAPLSFPNPLFKLHGSFVKGPAASMDSIKATLSTLFATGHLMNQEPSKRTVLSNILAAHPLVVMGYSGSDSFDITPLFKVTASEQPILWINHSKVPVYYDAAAIRSLPRDPANRFLQSHHDLLGYLVDYGAGTTIRPAEAVHLFDVDTSLARRLIAQEYRVSIPQLGEPFHFDYTSHFDRWFGRYARQKSARLEMQFHIWETTGNQDRLAECLPRMERQASRGKLGTGSIAMLRQVAAHRHHMGHFEKAIKTYWKVVEKAARASDFVGVVQAFNGMAESHHHAGRWPEALFDLGQTVGWASKAIDESRTPEDKAYALYLRGSAIFSRIMFAVKIGYPARVDFDQNAVFGSFAFDQWQDQPKPEASSAPNEIEWAAGRTRRYIRMHIEHAVAYCRAALDLAERHSLDDVRALCLSLFCDLDQRLGNPAEAASWATQALAIAQSRGDLLEMIRLHTKLWSVLESVKDVDQSIVHGLEVYRLYELLGDVRGIALTSYGLGRTYEDSGRLEKARSEYERALSIYRYVQDRRHESHALHHLGRIAQVEKRYAEAAALYSQSLDIKRALADTEGMAMTFKQMGHLYLAAEDPTRALENMLWARKLWSMLGSPRQAEVEDYLDYLHSILGEKRFRTVAKSVG